MNTIVIVWFICGLLCAVLTAHFINDNKDNEMRGLPLDIQIFLCVWSLIAWPIVFIAVLIDFYIQKRCQRKRHVS